jgi:hypothetical protein
MRVVRPEAGEECEAFFESKKPRNKIVTLYKKE